MKIDYGKVPGRRLEKIEFSQESFKPVMSVITPYYNGQKYIEQTANCILNQTFPFWEWIIIDDGSTDEEAIAELEKIQKLDKRIKILHKNNEGVAVARDYGIENSSKESEYVVFLDADDVINKTYLECAYWTLQTNEEATWTYTDVVNFGEREFLWRKYFDTTWQQKENLLVVTAVVKKEKIQEIGGFKIKEKKVYEDWYLWLRLMEQENYPVRMSFLGTWYRQKQSSESELQQANNGNQKNAMRYINQVKKNLKNKELKEAVQFPMERYNWELLPEKQENVKYIPQRKRNQKINILMIIPWMTVGGADKFNLDIVNRIDKEKFNITIITVQPNSNEWRLEFEENATVYDLTSFLERKNWLSFINYIIETNNIDLIFNTNSEFGYNVLPYLKANYCQIPIIDYVHMEEWYWRNGGYSRDAAMFESVIDKTYICNKNSENILINHFGKAENEVETVYIGVDEENFDPEKYNKQDILEELKIETGGKYILSYICRIAEQKRPLLLMQVIKKLKQKRDDFKVVIAGNGPMLQQVKDTAKKLKIDENIIFLGQVKETEKIYRISDITINCSIKEGLALTSYESLSMGVPVISADVGGQKELINDDVGVIVPCLQKETEILNFNYKDEEIELYVNGIIKILDNLDYYKNNARKKIINGFTINNMVEKMTTIFENTAKNPNKEKIENGKGLKKNISITKELITKYLIASKEEYKWTCKEFTEENVHVNLKINKKNRNVYGYEHTLEYKIKHPIVVVLRKMGIYDELKRIILEPIRNKGEE